MNTAEIYAHVTNTIIQMLEDHLETWQRPWITVDQDSLPARNAFNDKAYRGINQFLLSFEMMNKNYLGNSWATFKQVKAAGGSIIKGEKSTPLIFYTKAYRTGEGKYVRPEKAQVMSAAERQGQGISSYPMIKMFRVFNVAAQTEGLDKHFYEFEPSEPLSDFQKDERAEALIGATGAKIEVVRQNKAFYNYTTDSITVPLREQFAQESQNWYATTLHELGHWTGHKTRLNRDMMHPFGSKEYGQEELIVELASAYLCADLGFSKVIVNQASYVNSWLGLLKEDNKAVIRAASQAQKAADYILEQAAGNTPVLNPAG